MPDLIITVRSEDAVMTTAAQRARAAVERAKDLPIKRCGTPDAASRGVHYWPDVVLCATATPMPVAITKMSRREPPPVQRSGPMPAAIPRLWAGERS